MSHDDAFAEFQRAKREREQATVKVTWRRVSADTGGGWSGLGPDGRLVFAEPMYHGPGFCYGKRVGRSKVILGRDVKTLAEAKRLAEASLR